MPLRCEVGRSRDIGQTRWIELAGVQPSRPPRHSPLAHAMDQQVRLGVDQDRAFELVLDIVVVD